MSDEPDSLVLRYLRRLDEKIDALKSDVAELKADNLAMKNMMAGFFQNEIAQDSALLTIKERLDRVERRLDLSEDAR